MSNYFSDREYGPKARTEQTINPVVWAAVVGLVESLEVRGAFGEQFPEICRDGDDICGCNRGNLKRAIEAEMSGLSWPLQQSEVVMENFLDIEKKAWAPQTLLALDFIEFVARRVAWPIQDEYHSYYRHYHLSFDKEKGRISFVADINRLFARSGLAYQMTESGEVQRIASDVVRDLLERTYCKTGDQLLDVMLEESRRKFLDPDPLIRREALERLFDSWERIKSLADKNKALSTTKILDRTSTEPEFRKLLDREATELRGIGNSYFLRHHETRQTPVIDTEHVDYLFHRLYAMVDLVIRKNEFGRLS